MLQTGLQAQVDTLHEQAAALRAELQQAQQAEAATVLRASRACADAEALTAQLQQHKQVLRRVVRWHEMHALTTVDRHWQQRSRH